MTRFWSNHWQNRNWRPDINPEYEPLCHTAANTFRKRGVSPGDLVYVLSMVDGQLFLGGSMTVKQMVSKREAVRILKTTNLHDAYDHIIGKDGTPLNLHRRLAPAVTKQLRFVSRNSFPKPVFFDSETHLNVQATRGIRELTSDSAALLNYIIELTDCLPRTDQLITVTEQLLADLRSAPNRGEFQFPDEIPTGAACSEGSVRRIEVNRYERDPQARAGCIAVHGTNCCICGFSFGAVYGPEADRYIHVHHIRPLSEVGGEYVVDPVEELRPVCPNCHAVLHLGGRCRTIEEVRQLLAEQTWRTKNYT